jgi:hypothetical protein
MYATGFAAGISAMETGPLLNYKHSFITSSLLVVCLFFFFRNIILTCDV